ncbi:MAG TPA: UpxY family transcription antiterminator [Chthonomonadales bacterium]|nr:UpxY family transcription antiterminator [Chthonomonadales bacterium]
MENVGAWYALRVKPNWEKRVAEQLCWKGYEGFLPTYRVRRRWSDRWKELDVPLFPGYVFCRLSPHHQTRAVQTAGVILMVGFGGKPAPVRDEEIAALQRIVASGFEVGPWPYLQVGRRVRIEDGPLAGVEGILLEIRPRNKLVVSVTLLQRSVAVEVDGCRVLPVWQSPHAFTRSEDRVVVA